VTYVNEKEVREVDFIVLNVLAKEVGYISFNNKNVIYLLYERGVFYINEW